MKEAAKPKPRDKKPRRKSTRSIRDQVAKDHGLVKVRGNFGGVYYE